jgi:hypothetical protein
MTFRMAAILAGLSVCVAGCGTITQGTTQSIKITTTPPGATCEFTRKGQHLATLDSTPGSVEVDKTKNEITLTCKKDGYQDVSAPLPSGYGAGTFGNIILGGGIGWAIDSATGADNKYPSNANIVFAPVGEPAAAAKVEVDAPRPAGPHTCTAQEKSLIRRAEITGSSDRPRCEQQP